MQLLPPIFGSGARRRARLARSSRLLATVSLALLALVCLPGAATDGHSSPPLFDLSGHSVDPFRPSTNKATAFIFVSTDCPISNRYAPEIQRLQQRFGSRGVAFWLVYPDRSDSDQEIRSHLADYRYGDRALRDPEHWLVKKASVRVTPEAAVFVATDLVYHGRIDNLFADFGKQRTEPTTHELADVLEGILSGKRKAITNAPAIGCYIQD